MEHTTYSKNSRDDVRVPSQQVEEDADAMTRNVYALGRAAQTNALEPMELMDLSEDDRWALQALMDDSAAERLAGCLFDRVVRREEGETGEFFGVEQGQGAQRVSSGASGRAGSQQETRRVQPRSSEGRTCATPTVPISSQRLT